MLVPSGPRRAGHASRVRNRWASTICRPSCAGSCSRSKSARRPTIATAWCSPNGAAAPEVRMSDADTTDRLGDEVAGKPDGRQVGQGAGAPRADDDKRPDVEAGAGDPGSGSAAESGEPGSGQGEPGSDRGEPETEGAPPAVEPEAGEESQIDARPEGDDDDLIVRVVPPTSRGKDESEKLDQFLLRRYHLHGD